MNKPYILSLLLFFAGFSLYAQTETEAQQEDQEVTICTENLRLARALYEEGKLNEIPSALNTCLRSGFSPEEKTEAYRLIAISHLYLDEPSKADEAMLNLLQTNPEYVVNENIDPAEYINLYRSFRTKWLFRWGVKAGGVYTIPHVIETYPVTKPGMFESNIGFQLGLLVELDDLVPYVKLQPEVYFTSKSYNHSNIPTESKDGSPGISRITEQRSLTYIELFISAKYQLWENKNYFVVLSPGVGYLLSAEISFFELNNQEYPTINLLEEADGLYHRINPQLFLGIGTEFKIGRFYAVPEIRYGYSFMGLIDNRNAAPDLLNQGIGDSDYKLNSINFSISFLRATYKPKKITN